MKNLFLILFLIFVLTVLQSCGALKFKRSDVKDNPINDAEKREKNVKEGRGISIGGTKGRSGSFDFATSNEMWRAAMDVLDFVLLQIEFLTLQDLMLRKVSFWNPQNYRF